MDPGKILARFKDIEIEIRRDADPQLLSHLHSTILGTEGGMQYMHTKIEEKLANIPEIYFMLLKKSEKLLGSVGFVKKETLHCGVPLKSWYIRYFSIHAPLRTAVKPGKKANRTNRGSSLLKEVSLPYFKNPDKLEDSDASHPEKSILYAFIERENLRSSGFSETMGLRTYRRFTTILFSRLRCRQDQHVGTALPSEKKEILRLIEQFYAQHTLFSTANIFPQHPKPLEEEYTEPPYRNLFSGKKEKNPLSKSAFLVYRLNGKIVAGLQVHPDAWKITHLKSWSWFTLKFFPRIPGIRRIFNPENFRFIALEGIFYTAGGQKYLEPLLETACANFQTAIAMLWVDTRSPVLKVLRKRVRLGLMNKFMRQVEADIRIKTYGLSGNEEQLLRDQPAYISAFDMI